MKGLGKVLSLFLLLPLMAGMCNPDPGPDPVPDPEPEPDLEQPYEVSFAAKVNEMTTRATDTAFEDGDEISVYACYDASLSSSNYAQNVRYKYDKGLFESTYPISYPDKSAALTFYALYPYGNYSTPEMRFSVSKNQDSEEAYMESDLMTASAVAKDKKTVDLKFSHRLAKISLVLNSDRMPAGEQSVKFCKVYTSLDADIADNRYTETGSKSDVASCPDGKNAFKVILPPQKIAAGSLFAEIRIGDKVYDWVAESDIYLSSGIEHVYTATLKEDTITIEADINDWNEESGEVEADRNKNK